MAYAAILFHADTDASATGAFIRDTEAEARAAAIESYVAECNAWADTPEDARTAVKYDIDNGLLIVVVVKVQFG